MNPFVVAAIVFSTLVLIFAWAFLMTIGAIIQAEDEWLKEHDDLRKNNRKGGE